MSLKLALVLKIIPILKTVFHIHMIRVEASKEFCNKTETEYQQTSASMTALERVSKMDWPLKTTF